MLPFPLIYHESYDLNFGRHVFPAVKYRLIRERMLAEGFATPQDFIEPEPALEEDILRVHSPAWVAAIRDGALTGRELAKLEAPWSPEMARAVFAATGGTILAARLALESGAAFNVGGGFHHAFPEHGEGFCAIHDVAVAVKTMGKRTLIVDTDVHHGNGTAAIFAGDADVFTLSIHQFDNYPFVKPPSDLDVHLEDGVGDEEYLAALAGPLTDAIQLHKPDIMFYVAGADPYYDDQLGGLGLTIDGLRARDELVFQAAERLPVVVTLAGGYARNVEDTVTIHCNTAKALAKR